MHLEAGYYITLLEKHSTISTLKSLRDPEIK